jgi:hypothetical protein
LGLLLTAAFAVGLTSCGDDDSYEAVESGLRVWLAAVHNGDPAACDLMTEEYRRDFVAQVNPGVSCSQAVESVASNPGKDLPTAQSEMDAPAWDPSGEALIEVTYDQQVVGFWMQLAEERWIVAGTAT